MADFDANAHMVMTQNLLKGGGGASSGAGGGDVSFLGSFTFPSMESMPKKVQLVPVLKGIENLIASFQGMVSAVDPQSLGLLSSLQLPAGLTLNKKIAGIVAGKGQSK